MKKIVSTLFIVLLVSTAAYMQVPRYDLNEIKLVETNDVRLDGMGTAMISEYLVADRELRLTELRLKDTLAADRMLRSRLISLGPCTFLKKLYYDEEEVGLLHECTKSKSYTQIYSYGEKFYEISSELDSTVKLFTKGISPISCHLHGSKECISMYY